MVPPQSRRAVLCYSTPFSIAEGAAGAGTYRFYRLNSLYDVDTTLGSTATPGFSAWGTFFYNYRVWRTRFCLEATTSGGSAGSVTQISLVPYFATTLPASTGSWAVQPGTLSKMVARSVDGGKNVVTFDHHYDLASILRVTKAQYRNDMDYTGTVASNPTRGVNLAVTALGVGSTTAIALTGVLRVAFEVEFFNPLGLGS